MSDVRRCIYRDHKASQAAWSLEHIWPEALGGNFSPAFFKTDNVCQRCNNLAGLFVDGEFVRSFFTGVELTAATLRFLDTSAPAALPLAFMGVCRETTPSADEICESWLGPRGERIYFFHKADGDDFLGFGRGDPIHRTRDHGRVYVGFTKRNVFWIWTVLLSARKMFKGAALRLLATTNDTNILELCAPENQSSEQDRNYLAPILAEKTGNVQLSISMDHGVRFQCKLALGFGHTLYGDAFDALAYTDALKSCLWERDFRKRAAFNIRGTPLLSSVRGHDETLLSIPGTYTFAFFNEPGAAMSLVYTPTGRSLRTVIAQERNRLRSTIFEQFRQSFVVVIVPGQSRYLGPFSIVDYTLHRVGGPKIAELAELERTARTIEEVERDAARWDLPLA